jgi:DNA modification methylase
MLPALARRAIETYSDPGDLVVDPMCGIGTTLVEAIHTRRRAVGVELEPRWATLGRANIAHACREGARSHACVITGDARHLPRLLCRRQADLLLTSPPYGNATLGDPRARHGIAHARACEGRRVTARDRAHARQTVRTCRYGNAHGSVAHLPYGRVDLLLTSPPHAREQSYLSAMSEIYKASASVLKPGGFLVIVTKKMRSSGHTRDLASDTIALCQQAGLDYWQHVIALHATIRDGKLRFRPSFWQTQHRRQALASGQRTHLVCHEDVLVFRKPTVRRHSSSEIVTCPRERCTCSRPDACERRAAA